MSKPITISKLRKKLQSAIDHENEKINEYTGELNPQIIELLNLAEGRKLAFQAVLESIQGDMFLLNLYSE
jgi:hypothetical protein